jgi:hypothetical protein
MEGMSKLDNYIVDIRKIDPGFVFLALKVIHWMSLS